VLAAAIRVDRAIKRNIRRLVVGDDLAGRVDRDAGLERRQIVEALPAIVEDDTRERLEPP